MTPPQLETSTEDVQCVEKLIRSFLELIQNLVRDMSPEVEALCCRFFASSLLENNDMQNRNEDIEIAMYWYSRALNI